MPEPCYKANSDIAAASSSELGLTKDEYVVLIQPEKDGWVFVRSIATNKEGFAPIDYLDGPVQMPTAPAIPTPAGPVVPPVISAGQAQMAAQGFSLPPVAPVYEPHELTIILGASKSVAKQRTPTSVVVVLDQSGSMSTDNRLDTCKSVLTNLTNNFLTHEDQLGVVQFESSARIAFPLATMDQGGKSQACSSINAIPISGGTCIGNGVNEGIKALHGASCQTKALMLLTDGETNEDPLVLAEGLMKAKMAGVFTLFNAMGLGTAADSTFLTALVNGIGTFSHIQQSGNVNAIFQTLFDNAGSNVAGDINIVAEVLSNGEFVESVSPGQYQYSYDMDIMDQFLTVCNVKVPPTSHGSAQIINFYIKSINPALGVRVKVVLEWIDLALKKAQRRELIEDFDAVANKTAVSGNGMDVQKIAVRLYQRAPPLLLSIQGYIQAGQLDLAKQLLNQEISCVQHNKNVIGDPNNPYSLMLDSLIQGYSKALQATSSMQAWDHGGQAEVQALTTNFQTFKPVSSSRSHQIVF